MSETIVKQEGEPTNARSVSSVPHLLGDHEDGQASHTEEHHPQLSSPGDVGAAGGDEDSSMYKYRDFSHVTEDDEEVDGEMAAPVQQNRGNTETSIRVQKFPVKLYAILAQKEFHDIICWMPHGRSWKVLKPSMFESLVMPLFFEYSNYHSFNRLVNAWSFRRISSGPDRGSYYHELFLRGKPHLQKYMRRLPKTHKKLPMKKKDEPDFYKLDQTNPLPEVHEAPIPGATAAVQAMRAGNQQPGSPPNGGMSPSHMTPVGSQGDGSGVVTPVMSPNNPNGHAIIGGGRNSGMMGHGGNMGGPGMGMSGNMHGGMGGMGMSHGNMGGMGNMGGGMGPNRMNTGMNNMGHGNMGQGMGMGMGHRNGASGHMNHGGYYDSYDEYDMQHQSPMMGRGPMGRQQSQNPQHMSPMNNGYGGNGGYNNNANTNNAMSSPAGGAPSSMRRPIPMRQGGHSMEQMHPGEASPTSHQQEYYQGYVAPQSPMMPMYGGNNMHQQDTYGRGGPAPASGGNMQKDEFAASPAAGMRQGMSSSGSAQL